MARLAMSNSSAAHLASLGPRQSFIVVLLDNVGSTPEEALKSILFSLVERFPAEEVLLAVLTTPGDVQTFKRTHGLAGRPGPLVMVFEQNPFAFPAPRDKFLVDLSTGHTPDDIRRTMIGIAERAHDDRLIRQPVRGELLKGLRAMAQPRPADHGGVPAGSGAAVYRVLIASPGDLQEEREVIEKVVHQWNASHATAHNAVLLPVRWESHAVPEYGDRPQAILNRRLVRACDLLIGAFWTRVGTPTGGFQSGTLEEIEQITRAGKPALLYFSSRQIDPGRVDLDQLKRVREMRSRLEQVALVGEFSSPDQLESRLTRDLVQAMRRLRFASADGRAYLPSAVAGAPPSPPDAIPLPTGSRRELLDAEPLGALYTDYWGAFTERLRRFGSSLHPLSPGAWNNIRLPAGRGDVQLNAYASVRYRLLAVEVVLARPGGASVYGQLKAARTKIERELGHGLVWKELEGCYRIVLVERAFDPRNRADWARQHAWLDANLTRYQQAVLERIAGR
jgi:hypothetical protein